MWLLSLRRKRCQAAFLAGLMVFALAVAGASMVIPTQADGKRFSFTLMTNQGNLARISAAEIVKENLEDIGIDVNLQIVEWPTFVYENLLGQDFDAIIVGWIYGNEDIKGLFHSEDADLFEYNFCGYNNSDVDDLLVDSRGEANATKRTEMLMEIQEIIADEAPYDFLVYPQQILAVGTDWEGFVGGPHAGGPIGWWSIKNVSSNDGTATLIQASIGSASNLNPVLLADDASGTVSEPMYPNFIHDDDGLVPHPEVADNWTIAGKWFHFMLNNTWTWTDAAAVDTADFHFTYQLLQHANDEYSVSLSPYSYSAEWIDMIDVIGPYEVNVTADLSVYPDGYIPAFDDLTGIDWIPEHIFNTTAHSIYADLDAVKDAMKVLFPELETNATLFNSFDDDYWTWRWIEDSVNRDPQNTANGETPVTAGFWKFSDWDTSTNEVTLERDPNFPLWWQAVNPTVIQEYIYRLGGTMDEISLSLQAGEIDMQQGPNPAYVETLEDDPDVRVQFAQQLSYTYMGYNLRRAPFDDIRVRQAINWAVDKEAIFEASYFGYGDIGTGPIYKAFAQWYNPNVTTYSPPNPDLAEQLLDDAGWPRAAEDETDWVQIGLIAGIAAAAVIAIVVVYMVKIKGPEG
jgi:ABC-type transport system substrate-binding protein